MRISFITLILSFLISSNVFAHSRFLSVGSTPGRSNNAGLKTGPCGGVAKNQAPTLVFQSGQVIVLQWEETINHPGRFEFSISSDNDVTFQLLLTVQDTQNDTIVPHQYTANLKLPDGLICNSCTLQMVQQMTENPAAPRPYFSCSDIKIANNVNPTPPPTPVPSPTPAPTPSPSPEPAPDCH